MKNNYEKALSKYKLDPTEIEIMSTILFIDWKYKHLSREQRDKIIFNTETKNRTRKLNGTHITTEDILNYFSSKITNPNLPNMNTKLQAKGSLMLQELTSLDKPNRDKVEASRIRGYVHKSHSFKRGIK